MINLFRRLKNHGVLSINQRNTDFVLRYNPRKLFPLVDDKLKTKKLALKAGIAVPPLYDIIETEQQIKTIEESLSTLSMILSSSQHVALVAMVFWSLKIKYMGVIAKLMAN